MSSKYRICFVCLGNIVRSPLAENMFRQRAQQAGLDDKYLSDSAGTGSWHIGESPDLRMRRTAAHYGLMYDGRAKQFKYQDFEKYNLILAMDFENYQDLFSLAGSSANKAKLHMLREYDPLGGKKAAVPDPYYGSIYDFDETYQTVERSITGLLKWLVQNHNPDELDSLEEN